MKTAFSSGPGFFAAYTHEKNQRVPKGFMRFYIARLEAYDGPAALGTANDEITFKILAAKAQENPELALAMLQLHQHLEANLAIIREAATKLPPPPA